MKKLAIVIPAYKEAYFDKSLESLASQTVKDFTVYIGDDCSPFDLKKTVDRYSDKLDIKYTRFEKNIGSENIVLQWKRCVELSKNEEWLWLFSDDDIVDLNAVESFFSVIREDAKGVADVYRFNTCVIDGDGQVIGDTPIGPAEESSEEMAYNLLLGLRGNSMPDHIFSRKVYNENGGFVFTRYAQAADWATSILFSKSKGIHIIPNAKLYWRSSGVNISSIAYKNKNKMLYGHLQFIKWVINHFEYLKATPRTVKFEMIRDAARINLRNVIMHHYKGVDSKDIPKLISLLIKDLDMSLKESIMEIYGIKRSTSSRINRVVDIIKKITRRDR
ncbi:glycosyltransferase family 2 protein [Hymenobacter jejuensis]|uniref:Glycosyltransferase n=1 Tax=Hymenobacter jejuensis TaxID=2502781 RepID=A0A5B7ZZQ7_9BACT|nr:glycosyltransferase [Hymenobacter jejuensis]QDA59352.1 glycosyltransferase [Hymenobacter jejuensis]